MRARPGLTSDGARAHIDVTQNVVVNFLIYFKTEFLHFSARNLLPTATAVAIAAAAIAAVATAASAFVGGIYISFN